ncbi:Fe-S cluster assembly protein SufD [Streptomyces sp. SID3343]|uniref:Fe-S cluster assembly protein SufD n=1 Tax=Streptomyces sp. SID3343 TaxID=2690260 RepID=UPI00136E6DB0|nr:Fe-S cluster assembly protein SufD [Streptomyces sp. SID3343]MYW05964.1 Fe-S cluster assembly protein SufD [Streptomyces sp. SID3343]
MAANTNTPGSSTTAGSIAVREAGAANELAGPGTGRSVAQPADARQAAAVSYDVNDFAVPTGREENWRFTPLARLRGLHDGTAVGGDRGEVTVSVTAPEGVTVETVDRDDKRVGRAGPPVDRVAAQAYSSFEKATLITVAKDTQPAEPVVVTLNGTGGAAFGHVAIEVQRFAEAVVVLDHSGSTSYAQNVEFIVGDGAKLKVVSIQDWDADAVHVGSHLARVGRDASFTSVVITLGGDVVRLFPRVVYDGPGGDAELYGVYFADSGQHLEHRLFVDHDVPQCRSHVVYKGALQGVDAHTVWIGDVLIRAAAEGTDTYELNRNLVLTDGARADSVPNLEIETGEIAGAGHASATGRFDDEQLFYLQSRGIPADEARRLVVRGFFADVVSRVGIADLEERLMTQIEARLEGGVR